MPPKRPHSPPTTPLSSSALYVSKQIQDRASTFIAYFSPTAPHRQLQSHTDLTTASHRILAWRKPSSQKTLTGCPAYNTGSDDDGETYAGKKLLKVLDDYKVEGSIVVARWYGGQLLGPVRFQHIENAAKEAIRAYLADRGDGEAAKKTKVVGDSGNGGEEGSEKEKEELIEELKNRDESITVLRNLLDDKLGKKKSEEQSDGGEGASQPKVTKAPVPVDYESMPLVRLKQLDKARDNTISFLLKKIDEAEEQEEKAQKILSSSQDKSSDDNKNDKDTAKT
ncbi:hypothetical protein TWF481_000762 [Arthrobotrys musiformis]|uniref:Impact N-terminal domain-containing protein n=1 Tax=Arthrobotrys musiformis TaxID=47236 RepID=A0AAV9WNQ6_9PEZI